jgi:hypothetical protein
MEGTGGSSSRSSALQIQSPEVKAQFRKKKSHTVNS